MVKDNMCFVNFCDFYDRREFIRNQYVDLSLQDKAVYKYYVYSRRILKEKVCDMIWEYLNVVDGEEFVIYTGNLARERSRYL